MSERLISERLMSERLGQVRHSAARWRGVAAGAAVVLALTGCADRSGERAAADAGTALVGMSKGELLSCAGVPDRQTAIGGAEFLTYRHGATVVLSPVAPFGYGWSGGALDYDPWDYYPPLPGDVRDESCEANFTLRNGVVERLVYRATDRAFCAPIVRNCLARTPQRTISPSPPNG